VWIAVVQLTDAMGRLLPHWRMERAFMSLAQACLWAEGVISAMSEEATAKLIDLRENGFGVTARLFPRRTSKDKPGQAILGV
jgi:hypothetical protein